MKKITLVFLLLFTYLSYGQSQVCTDYFYVYGNDDDPTVLTINASDITCASGTINSITITDAFLDVEYAWYFGETYCDDWYSFTLNIDGEISNVCAEDLIGMVITDFQTLTITSQDIDDYSDEVLLELAITVDFIPEATPDCAIVTGPVSNVEATLNGVITWNASNGASGYTVYVGTEEDNWDVVYGVEVTGTSYDIPGTLEQGTDYYVLVVPYNIVGETDGCDIYSFSTPLAPVGSTCENSIVIEGLPYTVADDTANYFSSIYNGVPGSSCGVSNNYLSGNDVVYSYTATETGSITLKLLPGNTYAGMFVYGSCEDIGTNCLAGAGNSYATSELKIEEFLVDEGATYYIVISTWASPNTTPYTLSIVQNTCTNPTANFAVVSDCESGVDQFYVTVDITSLGSASAVLVSDNFGSESQEAQQEELLTFGPYENNTNVTINIQNIDDDNCFITSANLTQNVCPPNCSQATVIPNCGTSVTAQIVAGTGSWNNYLDYNTPGHELVYSFTPTETGLYMLEVTSATGGYVDYAYKLASGACTNSGWTFIDDISGAAVRTIGTLQAGETYLFVLDSEGTTARTHTFKIQCLPTCTNPTVGYRLVANCEDQDDLSFSIEVNVTDLGTASSLTITDDVFFEAYEVAQPGLFTFGPYAFDTDVIITTTNDQDANCIVESPVLTLDVCPPANDECDNATVLTVGQNFASVAIESHNIAATRNTNDHNPASVTSPCGTNNFLSNGKDVWFSVVVPDSGSLTIQTDESDSVDYLDDTALYVYRGSCDNMEYIDCNDDNEDDYYSFYSKIALDNLTPGETLFVRVWGYNGDQGYFKIAAYDASLSNNSFEISGLKVYPNPVKDVVTIMAHEHIDVVEVYNLVGQKVLSQRNNAANALIDMSGLSTGAYLVKVIANNQVQTIKVMKN